MAGLNADATDAKKEASEKPAMEPELALRNSENSPRSRLLEENRQQQTMTSNSSLKSQERLNDQQLASKLSTNRSSFAENSSGILDRSVMPPQQNGLVYASTPNMQAVPQQQAIPPQASVPQEQRKVDLYRERLAAQNSAQISVQQGTPTLAVSDTSSIMPSTTPSPVSRTMPSGGPGGGMGMAAGSMPGSGMSGMGSGSSMGMSGSGGMSSSARRSGEMSASMAMAPMTATPPAAPGGVPEEFSKPSDAAASLPVAANPTPTSDSLGGKSDNDSSAMTSTMATKYTSLDIEIPRSGQVYLFTAPQSDVRLSVSGISTAALQRLNDLVYTSGLFVVCALVGLLVVRRKR